MDQGSNPPERKRGGWLPKLGIGCAGVVVLLALGLFLSEPGKAIRDLWSRGILQDAAQGVEKRTYEADRRENLVTLATALESYHKSEDGYPSADSWMDKLGDRLVVNDLTPEEAAKKLIRPDLVGKPDVFGYGLNVEAAGKYKGDLKPDLILVFESAGTSRNLSGDPAQVGLKGGMAMTVSGKVIKL